MKRLLLPLCAALLVTACVPAEPVVFDTPWPTLAPRPTATPVPTDAVTPTAESTPVLAPTPTLPTGAAASHIVQDGEGIDIIAQRYNVPANVLRQYNGLEEDTVVFPGAYLLIPNDETVQAILPTPFPTISIALLDNPLREYSIDYLSTRDYYGGTIETNYIAQSTEAYTQKLISYQTDDNIIVTAMVNIPTEGEPPFPVIILLHGGFDQDTYRPGDGTRNHADFFVRQGYVTIAPDYRSYNDSEGTGSPLKIPWSIDVINLIEALGTMPEADEERIGVLGHSRGGGVGSYLAVLSPILPGVRAISFYNSLSFDQAVNWYHYVNAFGAEWPITDSYVVGNPESNPEGYAAVSPINYLDRITIPVQIHHGEVDTVLPVDWARDLYARLEEAGKDVDYYEYSGANHTFYEEDYTRFLERNLAFFETYVRNAED